MTRLAVCLLAFIRFIVTTPGEDASTQTGIGWHCSEPGSYLELSSDSDIQMRHAVRYLPDETKWHLDGLDSLFRTDRYVCKLDLDGLKPGRTYRFRVCCDGTQSPTGIFSTPPRKGGKWKFIACADFQHAFNQIAHRLVESLRSNAGNANLLVCSGDMVDYGASEAEWQWILEHPSMKNILFSASPGDHEYWGIRPEGERHYPMMAFPEGYNSIFNNPANGCTQLPNSSYWYIYRDVLFIHLDCGDSNTTRSPKYDAEVEWFKETVDSLQGKYKYLVVLGHKSMYGSYREDSGVVKYMQPLFATAFKEKKVDLVISGHDHMYSRTKSIDGTRYLDLGSSGNKARVPDERLRTDGLHEKVIDFKTNPDCAGAIVTVSSKGLEVEVRNADGRILDRF